MLTGQGIALWILGTIFILNLVFVVLIIFFDRKKPVNTLAWILTFTFLPVVGFILYLFFGNRLHLRRVYPTQKSTVNKILEQILIAQKQQIDNDEISFHDSEMEKHVDMIYMNLEYDDAIFTQDNEIEIYTHGQEKYISIFQDIENAQSSINLLYFIFRGDNLSKKLLQLLTKKAQEGVEVRLLYDEVGSLLTPKSIFKDLLAAGGQVKKSMRSILGFSFRANYRNHRKIVVIDGQIGYVGGMNIGEEYAGLHPVRSNWRDTHLRIVGSSVYSLQWIFLHDWQATAEGKDKIGIDEKKMFPLLQSSENGKIGMQIISSGPDSSLEQIKMNYIKMINKAKKNIYIETPYFVPDDAFLESLKIAAMSGVQIHIIIPGIYDKYYVYRATTSYIKELLPFGVKFYLYHGFMHAKMMIMDDEIVSIGSANIDMRSFALCFEVNSFIYDSVFTQKCIDIFMDDMRNSQFVTKEWYEARPWHTKFMESILRLLSPLF